MDILILETGEMKTLSVIDPRTDVDYIADFVGNADAIGADESDIDSKFVRISNIPEAYTGGIYNIDFSQHDEDAYVTSQDNYQWWRYVVEQEQKLQGLMQNARDMGISGDEINDALDQPSHELDDLIANQIQEISELIESKNP